MPKLYGYVLGYVILTTHSSHHYSIWSFTHMHTQHYQDIQYYVVQEMFSLFHRIGGCRCLFLDPLNTTRLTYLFSQVINLGKLSNLG